MNYRIGTAGGRWSSRSVYDSPKVPATRCECGAPAFCLVPMSASPDAWLAWWAQHPARAGIRPLTTEAAKRKGGLTQ